MAINCEGLGMCAYTVQLIHHYAVAMLLRIESKPFWCKCNVSDAQVATLRFSVTFELLYTRHGGISVFLVPPENMTMLMSGRTAVLPRDGVYIARYIYTRCLAVVARCGNILQNLNTVAFIASGKWPPLQFPQYVWRAET